MNLTDGIDIAAELMSRKAKQAIGAVIVIVALVYPSAISRFVTWYAVEKSHELIQTIQRSFPTPAPAPLQRPPAIPADRRLGRAGS